MPDFAFGGLSAVFDFGEDIRLNPDALVSNPLAVPPAKVDAVPIFAVEGEPCDRQRFALGAGLFHPVVPAARCIAQLRRARRRAAVPD